MPPTIWKKSSPALVERFGQALPQHAGLVRKPMFGYPAAFINGNMICGLFEESVVARLGRDAVAKLVETGAAERFAPIPGRSMGGFAVVPPSAASDVQSLAFWLKQALEYCLGLPAKPPKTGTTALAPKATRKRTPGG